MVCGIHRVGTTVSVGTWNLAPSTDISTVRLKKKPSNCVRQAPRAVDTRMTHKYYVAYPDACDRLEICTLSAPRGPFRVSRRTFSFASSGTVSACFDGTRGGPAQGAFRGLVRSASSQGYANRLNVGMFIPASEDEILI